MTRLNFDTHCEMNFRFYPFDKQVSSARFSLEKVYQFNVKVCSLNVESFGYGEEDINLHWKVENIVDEIRIDNVRRD